MRSINTVRYVKVHNKQLVMDINNYKICILNLNNNNTKTDLRFIIRTQPSTLAAHVCVVLK